jgi:hypothetical protein
MLEDGRNMDFEIDTASRLFITDSPEGGYPDWVMELTEDCGGCPGNQEAGICGAGANVYKVISFFDDVRSVQRITMTRISSQGEVLIRNLQASDGLRFIFLAALSFSDCPVFSRSAWAWEYYSDMIDPRRLFYVLLSSRLVAQAVKDDEELSLRQAKEKVQQDLRRTEDVFRPIHQAVSDLSLKDANVNALTSLIHLSDLLEMKAEDYIEALKREVDGE